MKVYAQKTKVPIKKSKQQIEDVLVKYGVVEYGWGVSPRGTGMIFKYDSKVYKMNITEPNSSDYSSKTKFEQARLSRWRLLLIAIKAKLNLILIGQTTFENEFLAYMALPDGSTVSDFINLPENIKKLQSSQMPKMLMATGQVKE